jgi:RNA polymerase sigma-70 factor (ECF subfamily)
LGLVLHVVTHTAECRAVQLTSQDREDLVADVFVALIDNEFAILRRFRGDSSLATYLTVIARRVVVRELAKGSPAGRKMPLKDGDHEPSTGPSVEQRISDREEIERLMAQLNDPEAEVVRMYHLEGKSYREISDRVGMPENSIGPTLSRARTKMRQASADSNY